ncbi:hypothetical protein LLH23_03245 [bacterium]|nr:hypothetical protein [bacterium]
MNEYRITIEGETATVANAEELVVALDVLQGDHDRAVLEQLRPHLPALVRGPRHLQRLLKVLQPEDQLFLLACVGPVLPEALEDGPALRDLLVILAEERVKEALLTGLGAEALRRLIETPEQLAEVLQWTYGHGDVTVLDLLGPAFLCDLLEDGYALSLALNALETDGQHRLIAMLGWDHVVGLVGSARDLAHLMRALPVELSHRLVAQLPAERVRALVGNARHWRSIEPFLEAAERACLRARLEALDAE